MQKTNQIITAVTEIYNWIDSKTAELPVSCRSCGQCCNFQSFGHRLYITTPELLHFKASLKDPPKQMTAGACPYNIENKCSVHNIRFASCRIFNCKAPPDFQTELTESALKKLKAICTDHQLPYKYNDLKTALSILPDSQY